jgi:hypothetical protein
MSDRTVQDREEEMREAGRKLYRLENLASDERRALIDAATKEIDCQMHAKYGADIQVAKDVARTAKQAYEAARVAEGERAAASIHSGVLAEWDWKPSGRFRQDYAWRETGRRGRCEVVTPQTVFPGNKTWNRPPVGSVAVRLLKKNGQPGMDCVKMKVNAHDKAQWLPEGEKPKDSPQ